MVETTTEPIVNFAEPIPVKLSERKSAVSLLCGVFACFGSQAFCAAFHVVWTDAKIQNSFVQNASKSKTQSQLTAVDLYQLLYFSDIFISGNTKYQIPN